MVKIKILFKTFLKKGLKYNNDEELFYNCVVSGFQGSGKTYFSVLKSHLSDKRFKRIITNLKSLKIPGRVCIYEREVKNYPNLDIQPFTIYLIDEIHKYFPKDSRRDESFYAFLQQMRKKHCMCIMTTQEWKSLATWLRYPCLYIYNTSKIPFSKIFKTTCLDGLSIVWDNSVNNWTGEELQIIYYKRNKVVSTYYDTNEII